MRDPIQNAGLHTPQATVTPHPEVEPDRVASLVKECLHPLADGSLIEQATAYLLALIETSQSTPWLYLRIPRGDLSINNLIYSHVGPLLQEMEARFGRHTWWWLRKSDVLGDALRLRILTSRETLPFIKESLPGRLKQANLLATILKYEPEICLFGGRAGMEIAHAFFGVDSRLLTEVLACNQRARTQTHLLPSCVSLAMCIYVLQSAGLDLFEMWDVFARILAKRPVKDPAAASPAYTLLAQRALDHDFDQVASAADAETARLLEGYKPLMASCCKELQRIYHAGQLECGVREFLSAIIIFHWNRVGFPYCHQSRLARAMTLLLENQARRT